MEGKRLLHSILLHNFLSYGEEGTRLNLEPLNVLIGPNASGKSNLINALSLLSAAPRNLFAAFREGGAAEDWLWKGDRKAEGALQAGIQVEMEAPESLESTIYYNLGFVVAGFRFQIVQESLGGPARNYFVRDADEVFVRLRSEEMLTSAVDPQESTLAQLRDPVSYPQLTHVSSQLGNIRFFRGWSMGRGNLLRAPQSVNLPDDFLLEDGSNLGLILNDLQNRLATKRQILEKLRLVYEGIEDVTTKVQGGTIQIFFHEEGLGKPIPAAHLSDGTLHYLCLLTVLLHPDPPPLICIEEPELGLHPDILPHIAELLVDASKRTQLIVTTHSETLVSALSDIPEAVVVCERDAGGTKLRRLDPENLKEWLERYRLGELWAKGEIGGNRW